MQELFIYLLKSSALIAAFFLAYHFLLRKETFFNSNRWFLIAGLITSVTLPLFFIKKIVFVETPKIISQVLVEQVSQSPIKIHHIPVAETFDWIQFIGISYVVIASVLAIKIAINFILLYRMLNGQKIIKKDQFKLVDFNKNTAPFSFFNYIVYNSELYSYSELQSILSHEKIHSREKHSIDALVSELFCSLFWINPFIWLYKKAITQNLEYIADQKAIELLDDKKSYQHALLKVVSHQNCLPITNNFYQSLIKKRIVMLNKNQSHKRNAVKYALIIPALIGFVFLFQVKVEAKEMKTKTIPSMKVIDSIGNVVQKTENVIASVNENKERNAAYVFDKISSDKEIKSNAEDLKREFNIDFLATNIKRNEAGEIIKIKLTFNDNKGNKGTTQQDRTVPIRPIFLKIVISKDGKNQIGFYDNPDMVQKPFDGVNENKITTIESIKDGALIYVDGQRYDKATVNELDPKGLTKIEVLTDAKSLQRYAARDKNEVYVITTNWSTRDPNLVAKLEAPSIITLQNGDEVVIFERCNMKIPRSPIVKFTENSPILIFNGVPQKNPRLTLESIDITKIKTIKLLNEKDEEVKGVPVYKMIISTK